MSGPRRRAREAAVGILYFWEVGGAEVDEAIAEYFRTHAPDAGDEVRAFAGRLVRGTVAEVEALDALIARQAAHWRLDRLAIVDRLILRMACWELVRQPDTPPAVVIDEAIELARTFGTDDSGRFVNGVLDGIRRALVESPANGTEAGGRPADTNTD